MLSFGVTVLPDPPYQRMIELMQLAEQNGFEYAWTYDSHILWEESYATLPLVAAQTIDRIIVRTEIPEQVIERPVLHHQDDKVLDRRGHRLPTLYL